MWYVKATKEANEVAKSPRYSKHTEFTNQINTNADLPLGYPSFVVDFDLVMAVVEEAEKRKRCIWLE